MNGSRIEKADRQIIRRNRATLSCVECSTRRIKCNRGQPCENCNTARRHCVYKHFRDGKTPQSVPGVSVLPGRVPDTQCPTAQTVPPATTNDTRYQRLGTLSTGLESTRRTFSTYHAPDNFDALDRCEHAAASLDGTQSERNTDAILTANPINGLSQSGWDILRQQSGLEGSQIMLKKTRTLRWSDWISMVPQFSVIGDCYSRACGHDQGAPVNNPEYLAVIAEMNALLKQYKALAKRSRSTQPYSGTVLSQSRFALPSRAEADAMADKYFDAFESTFRILHEPTFWQEYEQFWTNTENVPYPICLKVLLVISIGSSIHKTGICNTEFRRLVWQWIYAAQTWLSGPLVKDRLNISGIQIYCLTILARQLLSVGGDLTWTSMGSLIHMAMQIGLHRDPKHLPSTTTLQAEIRRRLWATILEMSIQSSVDSAMPPRISLDEFDTEAPANANDDELSDSSASVISHPMHVFTDTSVQLLLLDSLPLRLRILQSLTSLKSTVSYQDVLTLDKEINSAYHACSKFVKANEHGGITAFHRNLLEHALGRCLIPLHAPFATKAHENPLFQYSLKVSIDTALSITYPEPDDDFARLMALGSAFLSEGWRCAGSIISMDLIAQTEIQQREGTLRRLSSDRDRLKKAVECMLDLCLENIRKHVSNIKGHMFMSMVLAQVNAIETNGSSALEVARTARDSLRMCYELLQSRIEDSASQEEAVAGLATPWSDLDGELFGFDVADFDLDFMFPDLD